MCPSSSTWSNLADQYEFNYAMSSYIGATTTGRALAELTAPAETLLLGDSTNEWIDRAARIHVRHMEGANLAYADGHVKWAKGTDIAGRPQMYNPASPPSSWLVSGPPPQNCNANSTTCS